jgi:hypothetical protein
VHVQPRCMERAIAGARTASGHSDI